MSDRFLFTSESVTEGHPDKIADQVSDAILDACLEQDPYSRVAAETLTATTDSPPGANQFTIGADAIATTTNPIIDTVKARVIAFSLMKLRCSFSS